MLDPYQISPSPAVWVRPGSMPLEWSCNDAARKAHWARGWPDERWQQLARCVAELAASGRHRASAVSLGLHWIGAPLQAGFVAWLHPVTDRSPLSDGTADWETALRLLRGHTRQAIAHRGALTVEDCRFMDGAVEHFQALLKGVDGVDDSRGGADLSLAVATAWQWVAPTATRAGIVPARIASIGERVQAPPHVLLQAWIGLMSAVVEFCPAGSSIDIRPALAGAVDGGATGVEIAVSLPSRQPPPGGASPSWKSSLSRARSGIERLQGRVDVVHDDVTSTMTLRIWHPLAAPTQRTDAVPAASPRMLLYIEDDPINLLLVQELMVLRPGLELQTATDGASGVAMARQLRPALIFVDLHLPDMDGFEVLRQLQSDPALHSIPILALSASTLPENVSRARQAGFADYWRKPIDGERFLRGLDAWIGRLGLRVA